MKKVFISQSNYIPWIGYFDAINYVDEFIILDNVQYTKNDWRNRNKINSSNGPMWLSIPIYTSGRFPQKINEAKVCNHFWAKKHWKAIQLNYGRAPYFKQYAPFFQELYLSKSKSNLSEINYEFIKLLCMLLNISTKITKAENLVWQGGDKTENIINICQQVDAQHYVSGPSAKSYINKTKFDIANIELEFLNYNYNKNYTQLFSPTTERLSVLDLLFNTGQNAQEYFVLKPSQLSLAV